MSNSEVFLSYSHGDGEAAGRLRHWLTQNGVAVFQDVQSIREGDNWLDRIEGAVEACGAFVLLVGRDGVQRWVGAESHVALIRHFDPYDDASRLPIFPILLPDAKPPAGLLQLFQHTRWDGRHDLPASLADRIRERRLVESSSTVIEGCPYKGLAAFGGEDAHLFFGRQRETLEALARFQQRERGRPVRWLEINGNSGSGKSSLMQAGLLPLIEQGWLWRRDGRYERWATLGPMMPGAHPTKMLAEKLAQVFDPGSMSAILEKLDGKDDALANWLRGHKPDETTAYLLAIDQFEELFNESGPDERQRFDRQLATALADPDCPLYLISTIRADFLDRFAEDLPRLVDIRNRFGQQWTLGPISKEGLLEVIDGPARLAALDVSEVRAAIVAQVAGEPGALPLVENALRYLWSKRDGSRLSGTHLTDEGGVAGILSRRADALIDALGPERGRALELLFHLVKVDPTGRRHTRQRIPLKSARTIGGESVLDYLAGQRPRADETSTEPIRLISLTGEQEDGSDQEVQLIHETLIRCRPTNPGEDPQPYWPTLWTYLQDNRKRAARRERLALQAQEWQPRRGLRRLSGLAGWASLFGMRGLALPGSLEQRFLRWSRGRAAVELLVSAMLLLFLGENVAWLARHGYPPKGLEYRWRYRLGRPFPMPAMVEVPSVSYRRGGKRSDESPIREVTIDKPFLIGQTEVTIAEYGAFCEATNRSVPPDEGWVSEQRPVINVDWGEARAYARWLSVVTNRDCRLPSEAEWEYAARAGTTKAYALPALEGGSDDIAGGALANCDGCGSQWDSKSSAPVASFRPNAWGLYDMHGNVWEWVEDCWHNDYEGAPSDGSAWVKDCDYETVRVVRGGSWRSHPVSLRSAIRNGDTADVRSSSVGFRVVCSPPS